MATINGDSSPNLLRGTSDADTIRGLGGNDTLLGLAGNDLLEGGNGNDRLDGGRGPDDLIGGRGNDTYVVDRRSDRITENSREGIDTVESVIGYRLRAELENLILIGVSPINGIGNNLNNILIGNAGNNGLNGNGGSDRIDGGEGDDRIDGGRGSDFMIGGGGNDTYVVDNRADRVLEAEGFGIDWVESTVNIVLSTNIENLMLLGNAVRGIGNRLNNDLIGNASANFLSGGAGADDLTGGAGNDTLVGGTGFDLFIYQTDRNFRTADVGVDTITDFTIGTDAVVLSRQTFGLASTIGFGFSQASEFQSVANDGAAATSAARIVFSRATGSLFYNPNGTNDGFGAAASSGSFAVLNGVRSLSALDFVIEA